ncbi:MAG TPA: hypothetical protein VG406_17795 [Isosphaeraceae bacterium]|nr:hypothetical protein [Isosphaeraceae bacterium]
MKKLLKSDLRVGDPTSYYALLLDCLRNAPGLHVVPYDPHDGPPDTAHLYPFGGPNGALLVAMLRHRHGLATRIWSNDLVDDREARYRGAPAPNSATECPRTSKYAAALSGGGVENTEVDVFCDLGFPDSIQAMADWRKPCKIRIGFLDPDAYVGHRAPGAGKVDSTAHICWLTNLYRDAECTAGIMFFAHQMSDRRAELIQAFHDDAVEEYPHSFVFEHGRYMVGVKLRCQANDNADRIINGTRDSWSAWSAIVAQKDKLGCHVRGQT